MLHICIWKYVIYKYEKTNNIDMSDIHNIIYTCHINIIEYIMLHECIIYNIKHAVYNIRNIDTWSII